LSVAFAAVLLSASARAEPITLNYIVQVNERARVFFAGEGIHDDTVNRQLGGFEAFDASFALSVTFDATSPTLQNTNGSGGTLTSYRSLITQYGTPTFQGVKLPEATPLAAPDLTHPTFHKRGSLTCEAEVAVRYRERAAFRLHA
jgi:hypothetical protein